MTRFEPCSQAVQGPSFSRLRELNAAHLEADGMRLSGSHSGCAVPCQTCGAEVRIVGQDSWRCRWGEGGIRRADPVMGRYLFLKEARCARRRRTS